MVLSFSISRVCVWSSILFTALNLSLAHGQTASTPTASLPLAIGEQVVDYDVSIDGTYATIAVRSADRTDLRQWFFASNKMLTIQPPAGTSIQAIATHPADNSLILITRSLQGPYRIERMRATETQWKTDVLHETQSPLRRLIVSAAKVGSSYLMGGLAGPCEPARWMGVRWITVK